MNPIPPRKPFQITHLPVLARCYRRGFRSGCHQGVNALTRGLNRLPFYALLHGTRLRSEGELALQMPDGLRRARFNARNRQFCALYFDDYAHAYEPEVSAVLDTILPPDGVLYDIGANWGYFSFYAASKAGFRGQVHSFEPWPPSFADLSALTAALNLSATVHCHALALGAGSGHGHMASGSHSGLAHVVAEGRGVPVLLQSLDELNLPPPHLIKLDVEGGELAVLRGGRRLLTEHRPAVVFENSVAPGSASNALEVLFLLEELGYQLTVPVLVCRCRVSGREFALPQRYDPGDADLVGLEFHPFAAARRQLLRPYINVLALPQGSPLLATPTAAG